MAKKCELCSEKISVFSKVLKINDYNILCSHCFEKEKNIADEKDRNYLIEQENIKQEQVRKKIEEETRKKRERKELYKKEFVDKFSNLAYIYIAMNNKVSTIDKVIIKSNTGNSLDLFEFLTYEMYKEIGNSETMSSVTEILFHGNFIRYISNSILKPNFKNSNNATINTYDSLVRYLNLWTSIEKKLCNDTLNEIISGNYNKCKIDEYVLANIQKGNDIFTSSLRSIYLLLSSIIYADVFIRAIILSRSATKFINNIELYKMYKNLRFNTDCSIDEICSKLFPIYIQYYTSTFQDKFDENTFKSLVRMVDIHSIVIFPKESLCTTLYDQVIYENIRDNDHFNFKDLLEKIDNKLFFNTFRYKNVTSENNIAYTTLYHYIIEKTGESIPVELFFQIVTDKFNYIDFLKSKERNIELKVEKERLLRGDLSIEKEQEIDKFNFNNINT